MVDGKVVDGTADGWHPDGYRPRLVRGHEPLWRSRGCVQLGLDPRWAIAVDGLSPALAELVRRLDGTRGAAELVADAVAAGARAGDAAALLADLAAAGVIEDAELADPLPDELAADVQAWRVRTGGAARALVDRRRAATVRVHGDGRVGVAVAVLLAAAGVGHVISTAGGRVTRGDVGIGYLGDEVDRPRRAAAARAVERHRTPVAPGTAVARPARTAVPDQPRVAEMGTVGTVGTVAAVVDVVDVAVVADAAVHDTMLATRLVGERVPHLAVQVVDGRAVVGPLVFPGRTGCLRCADLHRSERDPCWPRLAAQLAGRPSTASHAGTAVAAGLAAEQVLGLLAGSGEPATIGAGLDLDPLTGVVLREPRPAHPECGCGAAPKRSR